ncbi:MAG: hypothetical protein IPH53_09275 [Flavobacteriales bacterium]|nr:hypothetical protein [Flavobacteriales bacterium]
MSRSSLPEYPLLSVSTGMYVNSAGPHQDPIPICEGDSVLLWCDNVPAGPDAYWVGDDNVPIHSTAIYVKIFPQDLDQNDTLVLCGLGLLQFELENDWTLNGQPWTWVDGLTGFMNAMNLFSDTLIGTGDQEGEIYPPANSGWFVFVMDLYLVNHPCDDSLIFQFTDSVYITFADPAPPDAEFMIPPFICPNDSMWIVVDCPTCVSYLWIGGQFLQILGRFSPDPNTRLLWGPGHSDR